MLNVSAVRVPTGSLKVTVGAVVSKAMTGVVCLDEGPLRALMSLAASFATIKTTVPLDLVSDLIVAV